MVSSETFDKTGWYDADNPPVHDGLYEWEQPERFFESHVVFEWRTRHWIVHWTNGMQQGHIVMAEAPCRWRGRLSPPIDILLEL